MNSGNLSFLVEIQVYMMLLQIFWVYVLFHFSVVCRAVDITHFRVPKFVNRKDEVTLECDFRMSEPHETLHSVKWYRIDHSGSMEDFFTFIPANNPPVKTYPRSGIKVDVRPCFSLFIPQ